jgi:hypothetical protein
MPRRSNADDVLDIMKAILIGILGFLVIKALLGL